MIELLLVVVLLLLLLAAAVFNFSTLQRGAQLDEGATQFEALLRFARAHAASTGRPVQVVLEADAGAGALTTTNAQVQVLWEPDPLGAPGVLEPVFEARSYADGIAALISIQEVRLVDAVPLEVASAPGSGEPDAQFSNPGAGSTTNTLSTSTNSVALLQPFPRVTFYPDGTSDSAEVILASRDSEDPRRLVVRLTGDTGALHRRVLSNDPNSPEPEPTDLEDTNAPPAFGSAQ